MANLNVNKVILGGRLTTAPETKYTQSGSSVTTCSMAVSRKFQPKGGEKQSDFFSIQAWGKNSDTLAKFFKKGSSIFIVGSIQNRSWEKDGQKHYMTDIIVDEISFVDSRQDNNNSAPDHAETPQYNAPTAQAPKFEEIKSGDELPF
jgi:single-strand DNA-binding protein